VQSETRHSAAVPYVFFNAKFWGDLRRQLRTMIQTRRAPAWMATTSFSLTIRTKWSRFTGRSFRSCRPGIEFRLCLEPVRFKMHLNDESRHG
jgi:hypothetical protein